MSEILYMNGSCFKTLRAVTVWCSGQHALDQTSKASYLFLHCLHTLQAMVPAKENASDYQRPAHLCCRRHYRSTLERMNIHRKEFIYKTYATDQTHLN